MNDEGKKKMRKGEDAFSLHKLLATTGRKEMGVSTGGKTMKWERGRMLALVCFKIGQTDAGVGLRGVTIKLIMGYRVLGKKTVALT